MEAPKSRHLILGTDTYMELLTKVPEVFVPALTLIY